MSSFSIQILETGIRNMMEFSRELLGIDWGCLHRPDMERLQEELRNKLSFIEYHTTRKLVRPTSTWEKELAYTQDLEKGYEVK